MDLVNGRAVAEVKPGDRIARLAVLALGMDEIPRGKSLRPGVVFEVALQAFGRQPAAQPGIGDKVTKVSSPGSSSDRSATTCLISELPKEIEASPAWQFEIE